MVETKTQYERVEVPGGELEFEVRGSGEPLLLVHGAIVADAFVPMLEQPALARAYRTVHYHRRGYGGSVHTREPVTIAQQARDALALLDHLGIEKAHIAGHSFGAVIALQLASEAPGRVATLSLLEPPMPAAPGFGAFMQEQLGPIFGAYASGEREGAMDRFLTAVAGPGHRDALNAALGPGWQEQALADVDTFFGSEAASLPEWAVPADLATRVQQPVLSVVGEQSASIVPATTEVHELLRGWLPQCEEFVLPGATHALQMMNPEGMAEGLGAFLGRHPIRA